MGSSPPAAFKAVEVLQFRASRAIPGSDQEKIAEIAIGYSIGRLRADADAQFIVHDCERNARHAYFRSRERGRDAVDAYVGLTYGRLVVNDGEVDVADPLGTEDQVAASNSEFCECALNVARDLGAKGPAFVRRLMAGDSIAEGAKTVGISAATAYRWRSFLAEILASQRYLVEVAA